MSNCTVFAVFAAGSEKVGPLKPNSPLEAAVPEYWSGPARSRGRPCGKGLEPNPRPAPWR
eukprot:16434518-Heterocapsa_arctica.AAC.1